MTSALSPDDEKAIMRGLAVQPLVIGVFGFLLFPPSELAIVFSVLFAIAGTLITGCVAYPMLRWFMKRGQLTRMWTLAIGAVLGNIPAAIAAVSMIAGSPDVVPDLGTLIRPMTVGTVVGVVSAAAFWALSGRHLTRPASTRSRR